MTKDTIYQNNNGPNPFAFDLTVTQVFDDMVHRSVPNYAKNLQTITTIAKQFCRSNTICYDLGCSLGKLSIALSQAHLACEKIIAMDNSTEMIRAAKINLTKHKLQTPIQLIEANLNEQIIHQQLANTPASVIILNYTLQFIQPENRLPLLQSIHKSLSTSGGGILILCEKVRPYSQLAQKLMDTHYYEFKRSQGYHNLEISRKREALENVLICDSIHEHEQRLKQAGFSAHEIWHKHWHFTSWIAWSNQT